MENFSKTSSKHQIADVKVKKNNLNSPYLLKTTTLDLLEKKEIIKTNLNHSELDLSDYL